jgi:hypothetical protein
MDRITFWLLLVAAAYNILNPEQIFADKAMKGRCLWEWEISYLTPEVIEKCKPKLEYRSGGAIKPKLKYEGFCAPTSNSCPEPSPGQNYFEHPEHYFSFCRRYLSLKPKLVDSNCKVDCKATSSVTWTKNFSCEQLSRSNCGGHITAFCVCECGTGCAKKGTSIEPEPKVTENVPCYWDTTDGAGGKCRQRGMEFMNSNFGARCKQACDANLNKCEANGAPTFQAIPK